MKLKTKFKFVKLNEELVAVPLGSGDGILHGIIKLNDSGRLIMEYLFEDTTMDEIVARLSAEYNETPKEEITANVVEFISGLKDAQLICGI